MNDEAGYVSVSKVVDLTTMADNFVLGWQRLILLELDRLRAELPYADTVVLTLECRRTPFDLGERPI